MSSAEGLLIVERVLYQTLVEGGVTTMRDIGGATQAMKRWVEVRKSEPGDVDGDAVDAFAAWVAERGALAGQTARLSEGARRKW